MITDLKPYAAYRTAEGGWLGEIPSHWTVRRMKYVVQENDSRSTTGNEQLLRVSQFTGVTQRLRGAGQEEQDTRAASLVGYKRVEPDELVINIMLAWNGSIGVSRFPGIASPAYCVYRFKPDAQPWYFHHLLRSPSYKARIKAMSTGVVESRLRLYSDDLFRIEALLPPPEEQTAIVRFLDWANARLERTIRAKRRVIALLTEQKQAIIHRAVTRGLDPLSEVHSTGNEWFPLLPTNCHPLTLRRVIHSAVDGPHFSPNYHDNGIPFLSARNVKVDRWSLNDVKYISQADFIDFSRRVKPEQGDVLYTKGGTTGVARVVDLTFPFQVWVHIAVLKLKKELIDSAYLALCLNSPRCYEQSQLFTRGATNQDLGLGRMKDIVLSVPNSVEVQRSIVRVVEKELSPLLARIGTIEREIDLLREYRTRLVADVVTGKLDVRAAAAALPQDELPSTTEAGALDADDDLDTLDESEPNDEETAA